MENNNFKHLNQETENLSKISSEQIRQIVCKEKNNWKIVTIVLAICSILISVCVVISFVAAEISLKKETPPLGGDGLSSAVRIKAVR